MQLYIGADVHAASTTFVALDPSGKVVSREVVQTNGQDLVGYLKKLSGTLHLCIEEGEWSLWLAEILRPHVAEFVVHQSKWQPGVKCDASDAKDVADRLLNGRIRPVFKDPARFTTLRELARTYSMVSRDLARVKNRLKSFVRSRGVSCSGDTLYSAKGREEITRELPKASKSAIEIIATEMTLLTQTKKQAESAMLKAASPYRVYRILQTAPGLGPIRTALLLPIVITPHRFRTKRQFWSYCGFAVVTRSSSDWILAENRWERGKVIRTRGLTHDYNRQLKNIFKGAATTVIDRSGPNPLQEHFHRLCEEGTKPNLARLTIARRIAAIVLAMWKKEEKYDPNRSR
jgi:transposase